MGMFFHTAIFDSTQHWLGNVICSVKHAHRFPLMTCCSLSKGCSPFQSASAKVSPNLTASIYQVTDDFYSKEKKKPCDGSFLEIKSSPQVFPNWLSVRITRLTVAAGYQGCISLCNVNLFPLLYLPREKVNQYQQGINWKDMGAHQC